MEKHGKHPHKMNARMVAKLKARFKGAQRRVNTLKHSITEISETIKTRHRVMKTKGSERGVKLSVPEIDDLRCKKEKFLITLDSVKAELKVFKANYEKAVKKNKTVLRTQRRVKRIAINNRAQELTLKHFQKILDEAAANGGKEKVISLKQVASSQMSPREFKQFVRKQTGVYIPKYADLSKVRDLMTEWNEVPSKKVPA